MHIRCYSLKTLPSEIPTSPVLKSRFSSSRKNTEEYGNIFTFSPRTVYCEYIRAGEKNEHDSIDLRGKLEGIPLSHWY